MRVARFGIGVVAVVALHPAQVNLPVVLGGIHHQIAQLHLVDKAEQLPGVVRDRAGLCIRINLRHPRLEGLAVGFERGQVAHLGPAHGDAVFLEKQAVGVAGLAGVDAPEVGVGGLAHAVSSRAGARASRSTASSRRRLSASVVVRWASSWSHSAISSSTLATMRYCSASGGSGTSIWRIFPTLRL